MGWRYGSTYGPELKPQYIKEGRDEAGREEEARKEGKGRRKEGRKEGLCNSFLL
jgi:hypothetical protein